MDSTIIAPGLATTLQPGSHDKSIVFERLVKSGMDKHEARKLSGVSWSHFYKNHNTIVPGDGDKYNPKNLASKAHKVLDRIISGKIDCKPGELLTACKMVFDRSHPINEPVVQAKQQFIQINVGRLAEAVKAVNAMDNKINEMQKLSTGVPQAIEVPQVNDINAIADSPQG
mgnify:CR=1 FL=1